MSCKIACVSYVVKATIDRPRRHDHSTRRLFKITPVVDLNIVPDVLHPVGDQITMKEGCLCCGTGPITLEVSVDKRGYVAGETMWVSGCVDNQSNTDVTYVTCTLTQTITFFAKSGWKIDDKRSKDFVVEVDMDGCPAYQKKAIESTPFRIPPVVPCAFDSCPNIFLEYSLKVTAMVGFENPACTLKLPIAIGTIAARQTSPFSSVNLAVTHQSEVKRKVPPPPSYDFAVSNFPEVNSRREDTESTRGHPARLFPDLPIIANYNASDNVLPVSCSPRSPSGKTNYATSTTSPASCDRRRTSSHSSTNYSTLPSAHSPVTSTSRSKYDTLPSVDRRCDRSTHGTSNYSSSPTSGGPSSSSPRPSISRLRYDSTPTSERSGESTALLSSRMAPYESNTYYDTSLGYGQVSMDPWRSQSEYIRDAPREQTMNRTRGRIAEAFV